MALSGSRLNAARTELTDNLGALHFGLFLTTANVILGPRQPCAVVGLNEDGSGCRLADPGNGFAAVGEQLSFRVRRTITRPVGADPDLASNLGKE